MASPKRTLPAARSCPLLRLNAQGLNVPTIAEIFQRHQYTVQATLKRWEQHGLE
ncbi:MAG: helix-turn-helix domain-containing protein [Cyanobacteria bacterium P01_F01_bin.56]